MKAILTLGLSLVISTWALPKIQAGEPGSAPDSAGSPPAGVGTSTQRVGSSPDSGFGAGLMLGEPTGVSLKYWLSETSAIDGGLGASFVGENNFHVHADYLYHLFDLFPLDKGRLPLYFGGGLRYKIRDHRGDQFGIRGVVGVSYMFDDLPIDVFGEVGPVLDLTPDVRARFSGAIGARFWF